MIGAVESLRSTVEGAFHAAVCHVDAESATHRYASQRWGGSTSPQGLLVLALGKAAPAMTRGLVAAMPAVPRRGVVVAAQPAPIPDGMELLIGSHPVPTEASLVAGERLLAVAASARPEETVVVLVSGGGSALAEALRPGISLDDLRRATETLLRSGAAIDEVNTVRQRVSRLKGGGLSAALPGAPPLTIAVSDVVGDPPAVIASGPTVAPIDDGAMARLHAVGVVARLPAGVAAALTGGTAESIPAAGEYVVVGNGPLAADGARRHLEAHGIAAAVADEPLQGEARHTALAVWDRFEHSGHAALV